MLPQHSSSMLAAGDPLITLLIFALFAGGSAFLNWLKKRQQQAEAEREAAERAARGQQTSEDWSSDSESETYATDQTAAEPAPHARSWEEELKRLLEGDFANPPPQKRKAEPPPLPPVVVAPKPQPVRSEPQPILPPLPPVFSRQGQTEDAPAHDSHEGTGHLATLSQSFQAYDRASHLSDLVAAKLAAMDSKTAFLPPETKAVRRPKRSQEMVSVLKLLRSPSSTRQVIIAQTVLGSPKGLEV